MSELALGLILVAAFLHAYWNYLVKRGSGGAVFVWMFTTCSAVLLIPLSVGLLIIQRPTLTLVSFGFMSGTAFLHLLYFLVLQRAYRTGDLSLVYPLARGTGPALSTIAAILILKEEPSMLVILGVILVILGVVLLTSRDKTESASRSATAVKWGFLCGVCIATYSVWDKIGVDEIEIPPVMLETAASLGISIMLAPYALRNWETAKRHWRDNRREIFGIAVFAPASYILILTAMSFTDLSYVAPSREISVLIGAILGRQLLGEEHTGRRMVAACAMVAGLIALAMG